MSWFSNRAQAWVVPQVLLLARPGSEVVLVSPWIDSVRLRPPFYALPQNRDFSNYRLAELLRDLAVQADIHVTLVVRDRDQRFARATNYLAKAKPSHFKVYEDPTLHAKAIVTERFVVHGSSNLLERSIHYNAELCSLDVNPYPSARQWVRSHMGLSVPI